MSAVVPHQPLFSSHLLYLALFLLYVLVFYVSAPSVSTCIFYPYLYCTIIFIVSRSQGVRGFQPFGSALALCLSRRRSRCIPVTVILSNLVLLLVSVTLYFKMTFLCILFYFVSSCGRSQVVSEAGAWSLARADPFSPSIPNVCSLPVCFLLVTKLTSGCISQVP